MSIIKPQPDSVPRTPFLKQRDSGLGITLDSNESSYLSATEENSENLLNRTVQENAKVNQSNRNTLHDSHENILNTLDTTSKTQSPFHSREEYIKFLERSYINPNIKNIETILDEVKLDDKQKEKAKYIFKRAKAFRKKIKIGK